MPKDARNQGLNLYLLHLIVSALQFTTQIHSSSGLALAEAVDKTNPRNTGCGREFTNALHGRPACFLPSRLQLHLARDSPQMCGEFKDLPQSLTYMEEHRASHFWTNSHRESEAFSCWKYHGEEGECLRTATASVVKGSLKFLLCFFVHNSICTPHFHLHSSCNLHNEHLQSLRSGFTLYHIYCRWPSVYHQKSFPGNFPKGCECET